MTFERVFRCGNCAFFGIGDDNTCHQGPQRGMVVLENDWCNNWALRIEVEDFLEAWNSGLRREMGLDEGPLPPPGSVP